MKYEGYGALTGFLVMSPVLHMGGVPIIEAVLNSLIGAILAFLIMAVIRLAVR